MKLMTRIVSSLEKCFHDTDITSLPTLSRISVLKNDHLSFQYVYRLDEHPSSITVHWSLHGDLAPYMQVRRVVPIPSLMPIYTPDHDDGQYLRTTPGLYPDLLEPTDGSDALRALRYISRALWLDGIPGERLPAGMHSLTVEMRGDDGALLASDTLEVEIIDAELPDIDFYYSQWLHCDCLADYYHVPIFSERHWEIIENFMREAVSLGINQILTPLFTPPLDTLPGGERPTVQLVDITRENGNYSFGYEKLDRWIALCNRCGIKRFEINHLYTQWGAEYAPKIMAYDDGIYRRIFGWETSAEDPEYRAFLRTFLAAFVEHMKARGDDHRCVFHISDEPWEDHLEKYREAKESIADIIGDYPILDAMSNPVFYDCGLVSTPVAAVDAIEPFLTRGVPHLWAYYCCAQGQKVSNRFFAMSSARNRCIGLQMYRHGIKGFLHWGYNFYYSQFSRGPVNPYADSCGEFFAPSGDPYSVYPAPDGSARESLRAVVFRDALDDMRALYAAEKICGRETLIKALEEQAGPIAFDRVIDHADDLLRIREWVNRIIAGQPIR